MSGDLMQIHEFAFEAPDGSLGWVSGYGITVGAANRRRILDREGASPRDDGWCYFRSEVDATASGWCVVVTRIRWDDPRLYSPEDAARVMRPWSNLEYEEAA